MTLKIGYTDVMWYLMIHPLIFVLHLSRPVEHTNEMADDLVPKNFFHAFCVWERFFYLMGCPIPLPPDSQGTTFFKLNTRCSLMQQYPFGFALISV
jgi:hypothetical protein